MEVNENESSGPSAPSPLERAPERRVEALREANGGSGPLAFLWEWTKIFWISVAIFLVIRAFFVEAFHIPTGSMENTLLPGDFLLVNKLAYGAEVPFTHDRLPALEHPKFGDVIVFDYPRDPTQNFVKRLVGLPGDTLSMRDGLLIRNGVAVHEKYVLREAPDMDRAAEDFDWQRQYLVRSAQAAPVYHPSRDNWGPLVVPPRHYFVLGDNRDDSMDSRYWGFVPDSLVTGRPILIYYSYAPDSSHQAFAWMTHVRWKRLGEFVR
ncbi:MAG TPA: signal peptidase I [Gemmatimonadaceae bacterium]